MKPPHGNRPGGSSRPPSDRGPYRGPGGGPRPSGQGASGPRGDARPAHGGGHAGNTGPRDHQKPRPQGSFQARSNREAPNREAPNRDNGHHPPRDGSNRLTRDGIGQPAGSEQPFRSEHPARSEPPARQDGPKRQGFQPRSANSRPREHGPRQSDAARHTPDAPKGTVWLYGHHAVAAALANPARRLRRLLLTDEAEAAIGQQLPPPWAVSPERVDRARLDHLLGRDVVHQGAALLADPLAPPSLQSVLEKTGVIVVLDQVTDPRNVGAILRSAAAFGAAAVITQDRNAPEETGGLAKAASGALEKMPLLRAVNITRTLIALKAANIWCIGLDAAGPALSGAAFSDRRVALVLGAEGEGLRRLTKETCDEIAGLAIKGAVESLNVSAAASVALYELTRR